MNSVTKALRPFASAAIFYYATIWLVVLVVVGTISQKFFGLQNSLEKYFSAWFIQPMEMPLWLPSGRLIMAIIMLNLAAKIAMGTKWKLKMIGINMTHLGVLLLMIGGMITAYTTTEGNLTIQEGTSSSIFKDFHKLELAVIDHSPKEHDDVTTFTDGFFSEGESFTDSKVPFSFKVVYYYKNCEPIKRDTSADTSTLKKNAKRFQFKELPTDKNDQNASGIEVIISGAAEEDNGVYILYNSPTQGASEATINDAQGKSYDLVLRPRQYELPFSIHLKDFEKLDHGGTMMARAYSSKVTVTEGASSEDTKIYMNHPLRRGGYTLYQASFFRPNQSGIESSVFQVVHNRGQLIPYIAVFVIGLGLLIHIFIQVPKLIAASKK